MTYPSMFYLSHFFGKDATFCDDLRSGAYLRKGTSVVLSLHIKFYLASPDNSLSEPEND